MSDCPPMTPPDCDLRDFAFIVSTMLSSCSNRKSSRRSILIWKTQFKRLIDMPLRLGNAHCTASRFQRFTENRPGQKPGHFAFCRLLSKHAQAEAKFLAVCPEQPCIVPRAKGALNRDNDG